MPEVPPSVTNYGVSEASDARGLEHTYMPSSPHSQSFHSQSAIMCLHTSLAIITSCSVITHPGPDITCPPILLFCHHTVSIQDLRSNQICPHFYTELSVQNIKGQIFYLTPTQFELPAQLFICCVRRTLSFRI